MVKAEAGEGNLSLVNCQLSFVNDGRYAGQWVWLLFRIALLAPCIVFFAPKGQLQISLGQSEAAQLRASPQVRVSANIGRGDDGEFGRRMAEAISSRRANRHPVSA